MSLAVLGAVVLVTAGLATVATAVFLEVRTPPATTGTTVVDDTGRTVAAPLDAQRVVVLAPNVMDLVYRLGLRDRVVGVGCTPGIAGGMANEYTPNQTSLWNLSAALCIADFPTLDTEGVAVLDPDLVLASTITSASDAATLSATYHLPVVILAPSTLSGVVGDVALLAQLFPSEAARATALEGALQLTLYNATTLSANFSDNAVPIPSVLLTYYFDNGSYYTYGPGAFGQSLIDLAGGSSISSGFPLVYGGMNASYVLAAQPQFILYGTSWNDPYVVSGETPGYWTSHAPYWSQLNGTKIPIDVSVLTEADATMILALPWLLHDLHPDLVPAPGGAPP